MPSKAGHDFKGKYLRQLPGVGKLMEHPDLARLSETCPRVLLVEAINEVVDAHKRRILGAESEEQIKDMDISFQHFVEEACALAAENARMSLRRAINATGDVLSRSLGSAPLNEAAQKALRDVAGGYSTLAVDADRDSHVRDLLPVLTGAKDGLVLNNNSGAVLLVLNTIACGKEVIVSRGQLIESDGFRLPDVIEKSGANIVSVGATNKTRLSDYHNAVGENTGAILRVHKSNYRIAGFSQEVPIQELAELGKEHNIPVVDDIGGGCLVDLTQRGLPEEPPAFLSIRNGADIVCFSGNKLLSGPQAGIVIGDTKYISMMRENPLYRILRTGKLVMAALEATLRSYLDTDKIMEANPALRFLSRSPQEMENLLHPLVDLLMERLSGMAIIEIENGYSNIEFVSAAPEKFPTKLMSVKPTEVSAYTLLKRLQSRTVPVFANIQGDCLLLDFRTVIQNEVDEIAVALVECCQPQ